MPFCGPHDHGLAHLALLHARVRDRVLHRHDDDVADRGVACAASRRARGCTPPCARPSCRRLRASIPAGSCCVSRCTTAGASRRSTLGQGLLHLPALALGERPVLDDAHLVPDATRVLLVVRHELRVAAHVLLVRRDPGPGARRGPRRSCPSCRSRPVPTSVRRLPRSLIDCSASAPSRAARSRPARRRGAASRASPCSRAAPSRASPAR